MPNIIAFAGSGRKCGKSTAAELIVSFKPDFKVISFANPLKEFYAKKYKISLKELYDPMGKEKHREGLQKESDEIKKEDPYFLAKKLFVDYHEEENLIIDDLRVIEELKMCLDYGVRIYKIEAEKTVRAKRGWNYNPAVDDHFTETELDLSRSTYEALGGEVIYNNYANKEDFKRSLYKIFV